MAPQGARDGKQRSVAYGGLTSEATFRHFWPSVHTNNSYQICKFVDDTSEKRISEFRFLVVSNGFREMEHFNFEIFVNDP